MLSPKQAAQPNPSYPALCLQDTTISMEHRPRRKHLNSDTDASNKKYLKEIQEKRKWETFFFLKKKNEKRKNEKKMKNVIKSKNEEMNKK